jgi:glycosyltransferase 2 family protein
MIFKKHNIIHKLNRTFGFVKKRWFVQGFKLFVSIGLVVFLLNKYDLKEVLNILSAVDVKYILAAYLWAIFSFFFLSLMYRISMLSLGIAFNTFYIMKIQLQIKFYSLFMPGGTNALVKWYKFSKSGKHPAQAALVMGLTRILITFSMFALALTGIIGDPVFSSGNIRSYLIVGMIFSLFVFFIVISGKLSKTLLNKLNKTSIISSFAKRFKKVLEISMLFKSLTIIQIISLIILSLISAFFQAIQLLTIAYTIDLPISVFTIFWLRGISQIAGLLPITISGLGVREVSMVFFLAGYGISEPEAISFSFLIFVIAVLGKGFLGGLLEAWDQFKPESNNKSNE